MMKKPSTSQFKNTFVRVKDQKNAEAVQQAMFNLGFHYSVGRKVKEAYEYGYIRVDDFYTMYYGKSCSPLPFVAPGSTEVTQAELFEVSDQMRKYKRWKRKDQRLRKRGWIRNTGTKPESFSEVRFNNGQISNRKSNWEWRIMQGPFGIAYYRPAKEVTVTVEQMVEDVAESLGKQVAIPYEPATVTVPVAPVATSPDTNPKRQYGVQSVPLNMWSPLASAYGALGLYNGSLKYGKANFANTPVEASIYIAAAMRHLAAWASGQEDDPADGVPNLGGVLANVAILLEARAAGTLIDDRLLMSGYLQELEMLRGKVKHLNELHADKNPKHFTLEG